MGGSVICKLKKLHMFDKLGTPEGTTMCLALLFDLNQSVLPLLYPRAAPLIKKWRSKASDPPTTNCL